MTELEQKVLDIINETIEGQYIGKFKVLVDDVGYHLYLYFDRELTPTVFSCEGNEEYFLNYIRDEFKKRKMEKIKYWRTIRQPITEDVLRDNEINTGWDDV